ncbi:hypothetical protein B0H13DRAFT_2327475 [Mycena leptocephala]|nr:hypothetical protein B0H13DRAFT_2327475 [Mycena leptocephala]
MSSPEVPSVGGVGAIYVEIFGPIFWGFCATLILCGVSTLQGYIYFTRYSDRHLIRAMAVLMLVLDFLSMSLICQSLYYYILPHFGSLAPLGAVTGELSAECLISAVITFISQMYFVYQLQVVKSRAKAAPIMNALIILAGINKAFGAAADVVATIAMCMFLKSADTGIRRTSSLLRSLMHLVINRGLLVTFAQILMLIVFFTSTHQLYWVAVHINTTKLYVNTFFAMLNARTPPEANHMHIGMSGVSSTKSGTITQTDSSFEVTKFPDFGNHDGGVGTIKVTTTSTVADI